MAALVGLDREIADSVVGLVDAMQEARSVDNVLLRWYMSILCCSGNACPTRCFRKQVHTFQSAFHVTIFFKHRAADTSTRGYYLVSLVVWTSAGPKIYVTATCRPVFRNTTGAQKLKSMAKHT